MRVLDYKVSKIHIQVWNYRFVCIFLRKSAFQNIFLKKAEGLKSFNSEDTTVWEGRMEGEHAFNSFPAHSESKQVVNPRAVTLRLPWRAGSPANERGAQWKSSKNGLQPSTDLTFYSELYLKLASPFGIHPIFNKTEDKVVCVRKRQTSGNIINDPPLTPSQAETQLPRIILWICMWFVQDAVFPVITPTLLPVIVETRTSVILHHLPLGSYPPPNMASQADPQQICCLVRSVLNKHLMNEWLSEWMIIHSLHEGALWDFEAWPWPLENSSYIWKTITYMVVYHELIWLGFHKTLSRSQNWYVLETVSDQSNSSLKHSVRGMPTFSPSLLISEECVSWLWCMKINP